MKQKEVISKIGVIIRELNDQYEYLQETSENLNDLELELFVSNARFLTGHIEILCKLNLQNTDKNIPSPIPEKTTEPKYFEPVVQEKHRAAQKEDEPDSGPDEPKRIEINQAAESPVPHIDLQSAGTEDDYSFTREEPETIRHELVLDESINWDDDEDLPDEEKLPAPKAPRIVIAAPPKGEINKPEEKTPAPGKQTKSPEDIHDDVLTINQKISSQLKEKLPPGAEQSTVAPITDIKQAINLNDKMLYIKDLFNGYSPAYSEAIEILNRFSSFDEATRFLNANYALKNHWEAKPATAEKFYALLKRRYA